MGMGMAECVHDKGGNVPVHYVTFDLNSSASCELLVPYCSA
jgi:hypothetical protein